MNPLVARSQFIDAVSQEIRFRASELVPHLTQTVDALGTFGLNLR